MYIIASDSLLQADAFLLPCSRDADPHEHWRILFVEDDEVVVQDWGYHSASEARSCAQSVPLPSPSDSHR